MVFHVCDVLNLLFVNLLQNVYPVYDIRDFLALLLYVLSLVDYLKQIDYDLALSEAIFHKFFDVVSTLEVSLFRIHPVARS